MAESFAFPLHPAGSGTAFGWTGPSKSELEQENLARTMMKLASEQGMAPEEIYATWGKKAGLSARDIEALTRGERERTAMFQRAVGSMQPSTTSTLTGQTQLGPVQQEPMFDFMRQFDQPPTSMANAMFQPPAATTPLGLQTPSRATWGDEARFPQGGPTTPSYGLTDADVEAGGPMMARLRDYERMFTTPTTMAADLAPRYALPPTVPEEVGGATAYAPPSPPPDVIPEYLRRPDTPTALSDMFVPGGQRVTQTVPGQDLLTVIAENPQLYRVLLANPDLLKLLQQEQENQAWVAGMRGAGVPGAAVPAVGVAPPVTTGTAAAVPGVPGAGAPSGAAALREEAMLARATARREQLQSVVDRIDADPTGRMAASPRGKVALEQYQKAVDDERAAAAALREAQKAQREAAPTEFSVDYARARRELRDQLGREPTEAELGVRVREIREQAEKPILIEGQPYRMVRNAQGEPVMQPLPGVPKKAEKPWYEGITKAEAIAMSTDPALPPERRRDAAALADRLQTESERTQAAGVVKSTQASLGKETERFNMLRALTQVEDLAKANPNWIGGSSKPMTAAKYAAAYDAPDKLKGTAAWLAGIPPGYNVFRANLDAFTAEKLHELAGSALTPGEIARYAAFLPSVWQSEARFMASVQVGREMMIGAMKYHEAREQGKSAKDAQDIAREAIEAAYQRGVQKYGDPYKPTSGGPPVQVPRHGLPGPAAPPQRTLTPPATLSPNDRSLLDDHKPPAVAPRR